MQIERKKAWNEEQIAFIGTYFGAIQGKTCENMKTDTISELNRIKMELKN